MVKVTEVMLRHLEGYEEVEDRSKKKGFYPRKYDEIASEGDIDQSQKPTT